MKNKDGIISPDGAGYSFDKKAWAAAAEEGIRSRIIRHLRIFDRPASVKELTDVICLTGNIPYTEHEIRSALDALVRDGQVRPEKEGYSLSDMAAEK